MERAARSVRFHGLYLAILGAGAVLRPYLLLALLQMPPSDGTWIRVAGVLLLGILFVQASRHDARWFFTTSVVTRLPALSRPAAFVTLGGADPVLVLFGGVDAAGALWTTSALRDGRRG